MGTSDARSTTWGGRSTTWGGRSTTWGGRGRLAAVSLSVVALIAPALGAVTARRSRRRDARPGDRAAPHRRPGGHPGASSSGNASSPGQEKKAAKNAASDRLSVRELVGADRLGTGKGRTIAVVDSGVEEVPALAGRVVQGYDATGSGFRDGYGHGTFVASLAAGNGVDANGKATGLTGVAPQARVVSVKVSDSNGHSSVGQVVDGLAWVLANRERYDIDAVSLALSVKTDEPESYDRNPINALVEALWFSGVTVVASAGNDGKTVRSAPGNDPFVITTGTVADANTVALGDDSLSVFSNTGTTVDGVAKPEVTTVGQHVRAALPADSRLAQKQVVTGLPAGYGQMSGTSMSTGVIAGVAVLLEAPGRGSTPDEIKSRLVATRSAPLAEAVPAAASSAGRVADANAGLRPSAMLAVAYAQHFLGTSDYASVRWSDVTWSSVTWSDVTWSSVTWSSVTWSDGLSATATWSDATWSSATWSDATWSSATWSSSRGDDA